MSFTSTEETTLKKIAKTTKYEDEILAINEAANTERSVKQDEIEAIETKRLSDVKTKQDLINAL